MFVDKNPSPDDIEKVIASLSQYNAEYVSNESEKFRIVIKSDNGEIIGGMIGDAHWGKLEIDILWISNNHRGQGIGRQLLEEAEKFALEQSCNGIVLYTMSFQAEGFYKKFGFVECGRIGGYENNAEKIYLVKDIYTDNREVSA